MTITVDSTDIEEVPHHGKFYWTDTAVLQYSVFTLCIIYITLFTQDANKIQNIQLKGHKIN